MQRKKQKDAQQIDARAKESGREGQGGKIKSLPLGEGTAMGVLVTKG